jgi:hypothetical protein
VEGLRVHATPRALIQCLRTCWRPFPIDELPEVLTGCVCDDFPGRDYQGLASLESPSGTYEDRAQDEGVNAMQHELPVTTRGAFGAVSA